MGGACRLPAFPRAPGGMAVSPLFWGLAALAGALGLCLALWAVRMRRARRPGAVPAAVAGPARLGPEVGPLARAVYAATLWGTARGAEIAERVRLAWPEEYGDLPTIAVYPLLRQLERLRLIRSVRVLSGTQGAWHRCYSAPDASRGEAGAAPSPGQRRAPS